MQLTKQPTTTATTTTIICGCRMPLFRFPLLPLSVTHGAAWHSLTCCLNESDIMWHTFSTASPVIAFVCRAAYDGYCLPPATYLLPPASCHRTAPTTCRQQLPPPPQLQLQVATATASCCWCQLQMSFSAVAACKSERVQAYATVKCPFNYNLKKKKQQLAIQLSCQVSIFFLNSHFFFIY